MHACYMYLANLYITIQLQMILNSINLDVHTHVHSYSTICNNLQKNMDTTATTTTAMNEIIFHCDICVSSIIRIQNMCLQIVYTLL